MVADTCWGSLEGRKPKTIDHMLATAPNGRGAGRDRVISDRDLQSSVQAHPAGSLGGRPRAVLAKFDGNTAHFKVYK